MRKVLLKLGPDKLSLDKCEFRVTGADGDGLLALGGGGG